MDIIGLISISYMTLTHTLLTDIEPSFQWALQPHIDINIWSVSWYNINRPTFDILLMSNCKYHMDINTWAQYEVKNVSIKWPLAKQIWWKITTTTLQLIDQGKHGYESQRLKKIYCGKSFSIVAIPRQLSSIVITRIHPLPFMTFPSNIGIVRGQSWQRIIVFRSNL